MIYIDFSEEEVNQLIISLLTWAKSQNPDPTSIGLAPAEQVISDCPETTLNGLKSRVS